MQIISALVKDGEKLLGIHHDPRGWRADRSNAVLVAGVPLGPCIFRRVGALAIGAVCAFRPRPSAFRPPGGLLPVERLVPRAGRRVFCPLIREAQTQISRTGRLAL